MQAFYPIYLSLAQRKVLIVGGGSQALQKLATLASSGADVTVVAPTLRGELSDWGGSGTLTLLRQPYTRALIADQAIVFAATSDSAVNHRVVCDARAAGILANAVDDPAHCDFFTPSVVRRGPLTVAISSAGCFPGACKALREILELILPAAHDQALTGLMVLRARLKADPQQAARRGAALRALAARFRDEYLKPVADLAQVAIHATDTVPAAPAPYDTLEHDA